MVTHDGGSASEHFEHIDHDGVSNQVAFLDPEFPPVPIVEEDIPESNSTHMFHDGS